MPSPFPGMDPYLQAHWGDVHHRLITYASDQLQRQLPADLRARVEERVFVEAGGEYRRSVAPDVRVVERPGKQGETAASSSEGEVAVAEPLIVHMADEPVTEGFIEIRDQSSGNRVVTVVEVLSLSNKLPGRGQELYLQKQQELKAGRVSLVELDFLRSGQHVLMVPWENVPESHRTPYLICVHRGWHSATYEVYRVPLRERLPIIRIPLRQTDEDVHLDLQAIADECYLNGAYDDDIDYTIDPNPSLNADDAAWADALLREKTLQ